MIRYMALLVVVAAILAGCGESDAGTSPGAAGTATDTATEATQADPEPTEETRLSPEPTVPIPNRGAEDPTATEVTREESLPPQFGSADIEQQSHLLQRHIFTALIDLGGADGGVKVVEPQSQRDETCGLPALQMSPAGSEATFGIEFESKRPDYTGRFTAQFHFLVDRGTQHFAMLDEHLQGLAGCPVMDGFPFAPVSVEPLAIEVTDADDLTAVTIRTASSDKDQRTLAIAVARVHNVVVIIERETSGEFLQEPFAVMVRRVIATTRETLTQAAQPEPTVIPKILTPQPTASPTATPTEAHPTPTGPTPTPYPELPALPLLTTCEQIVDARLAYLQLWLDALADLPLEVVLEAEELPENYQVFLEAFESLESEFAAAEVELGCDLDEQERLLVERLDELVANNPTAQRVLDLILQFNVATPPSATPTPASTPRPIELDWNVETCEAVADLFIDRIQILLYELDGVTLEELTQEEGPQSMVAFEADMERLEAIWGELGCDEEEILALVAERFEQLEATSPLSQLVLEAFEEAVENEELFEGV